jgi:hypothetical protein
MFWGNGAAGVGKMSKGEGGGVSIGYGYPSLPVSGEKRTKLTQPTELDTHLTQKAMLEKKRKEAEMPRKRSRKKVDR